MAREKDRQVVVVDPKLFMERMLHYRERHHGWRVFRSFYWAIYLILIGFFLIYYNTIAFTLNLFLGVAVLLFAMMFIVYGLAESLHHKLMKRYG